MAPGVMNAGTYATPGVGPDGAYLAPTLTGAYDGEGGRSLYDNEGRKSIYDNDGVAYDNAGSRSLYDNESRPNIYDNQLTAGGPLQDGPGGKAAGAGADGVYDDSKGLYDDQSKSLYDLASSGPAAAAAAAAAAGRAAPAAQAIYDQGASNDSEALYDNQVSPAPASAGMKQPVSVAAGAGAGVSAGGKVASPVRVSVTYDVGGMEGDEHLYDNAVTAPAPQGAAGMPGSRTSIDFEEDPSMEPKRAFAFFLVCVFTSTSAYF
jgi:hypothetical protein